MNDAIRTIFLGLVQGLTEFLPISSTGHMLIAQKFVKLQTLPLDLILGSANFGSMLALLYTFKDPFVKAIHTFHRSKYSRSFLFSIFIATIPAVVCGLLFRKKISLYFYGIHTIGYSLIIGGLFFLLLSFRKRRTEKTFFRGEFLSPSPITSSIIGAAQAVAFIPGVSRSGATIASSVLLGMDQKTATEFSFLLAVPIIFGLSMHQTCAAMHEITTENFFYVALSMVSAGIASFLVIKPSIAFVSKRGLAPFGYYRILFGLMIIFFF